MSGPQLLLRLVVAFAVAVIVGTLLSPPAAFADGFLSVLKGRGSVAKEVAQFGVNDGVGIGSLAFSADSSELAITSVDSSDLHILTWRDGRTKSHPLAMAAIGVNLFGHMSVAFSRDGNFLAAVHEPDQLNKKLTCAAPGNCTCKTVQIWDARSESPLIDLDDLRPSCNAEGIAFSNDSALLFIIELPESACASRAMSQIVLFSTSTWKPISNICVGVQFIYALAPSPDGKFLAIGGNNWVQHQPDKPQVDSLPIVAIVDIGARKTARIIDNAFPEHFDILALAWSPDAGNLAVGAGDRSEDSRADALKIYDSSTGVLVRSENSAFSNVSGLAYTSDGRYFVEGLVNKEAQIWNGTHEYVLQHFKYGWGDPFGDNFQTVAVSPNNRYLAISQWRHVTVYELR